MKMAFAATIVAALTVFVSLPTANSNASGVIPEARANSVIQEAKAVDVKVPTTRVDFGGFNAGLPMTSGFDRQHEAQTWWKPQGTAPSVSWVVALGFLGLIVLRRTRNSMF
jgi:hypothetical protein